MEVDRRSVDHAVLRALDARFHKAIDGALTSENGRWNQNGRVSMEETLVGNRPAGRTPAASAIVEAAVSASWQGTQRALLLAIALAQ